MNNLDKNFSEFINVSKIIPSKKESGLKNNPTIKDNIRVIKTMDLYLLGEKSWIRKTVMPTIKTVIYFDDIK